jgi:hypothetical protein
MEESAKIIIGIDQFHFKNDDDYLDVEVNNQEGYIILKTDTSGQFTIESVEQLDQIYHKLKEIFKQIDNYKND